LDIPKAWYTTDDKELQEKVFIERMKVIGITFDHSPIVLYIGACPRRYIGLKTLCEHSDHVSILEIYEPNIIEMRRLAESGKSPFAAVKRYYHGDAINASKIFRDKLFDVILWWNGPEHMTVQDAEFAIDDLKTLAAPSGKLILGSPWGRYPQAEKNGNRYEVHLSSWYPANYQKLGFKVRTDGKPNMMGSCITAFWTKKD